MNLNNKRRAWNKGLTKETDERVFKIAKSYRERLEKFGNPLKGRKLSEDHIKKLKQNTGGPRRGAGRGKGGWYRDVWCDSTYELVWLIYNLDHGIIPIRNSKGYQYKWYGKLHLYYPDFLIGDVLYEIKGYETNKDLRKYKAVDDKQLFVLKLKDLKQEFSYVKNNYTYSLLTELYEKSKFKFAKRKQSEKNYCKCGQLKNKKSKNCQKCSGKFKTETALSKLPDKNELLKLLNEQSYEAIGRLFGVVGNTIKKWSKFYGINLGNRVGYWQKINLTGKKLGPTNIPSPLRKIAPDGMSWCSRHKAFLPIKNFGKANSRWSGLHQHCKQCRHDTDKRKFNK